MNGCQAGQEAAAGETIAADQHPVTVSRILEAWNRRERAVRTCRFVWDQERTYMKYWATCLVPRARDEYVTLTVEDNRLHLDGDLIRFDAGRIGSDGDRIQFDGSRHLDPLGRVRYDDARRSFRDDRIRYDQGRRRVDPRSPQEYEWPRNLRSFTAVFDGHGNAEFLPAERGLYPEGYIFAEAENRYARSLYYRPIVLAVRPTWLDIRPEDCRIDDERPVLQDRECVVLSVGGALVRQFWVDPQRDFVVVRSVEDCDVLGARMQTQFDISYGQDPKCGWVPAEWRTVFFDNKGLAEQYAPTIVTGYAINESIPADAFQLTYPAGTWVRNEWTDEIYLLREGGEKRTVTSDELSRAATYADLAETASGMAGLSMPVWRFLSGGAASAMISSLLLVLALWLLIRRRRSRAAIR